MQNTIIIIQSILSCAIMCTGNFNLPIEFGMHRLYTFACTNVLYLTFYRTPAITPCFENIIGNEYLIVQIAKSGTAWYSCRFDRKIEFPSNSALPPRTSFEYAKVVRSLQAFTSGTNVQTVHTPYSDVYRERKFSLT